MASSALLAVSLNSRTRPCSGIPTGTSQNRAITVMFMPLRTSTKVVAISAINTSMKPINPENRFPFFASSRTRKTHITRYTIPVSTDTAEDTPVSGAERYASIAAISQKQNR